MRILTCVPIACSNLSFYTADLMADELDVDAMLEAPITKHVSSIKTREIRTTVIHIILNTFYRKREKAEKTDRERSELN